MKEICLSFEVRIRLTGPDVNCLKAALLAERERYFDEALSVLSG